MPLQQFLAWTCILLEIYKKNRQYGSCALHAEYVRLYTHTLRICYTYWYATATIFGMNAPETYVTRILTVLSHLLKSHYTIIITITITNDDKHSNLNKSNRRWFYNIFLNQLNDCGHSKQVLQWTVSVHPVSRLRTIL